MKRTLLATCLILLLATGYVYQNVTMPIKWSDFTTYGTAYLPSAARSIYETYYWPLAFSRTMAEGVSSGELQSEYPIFLPVNEQVAKARIHWYRGEFSQAKKTLEDHIAEHGESEEALYWLAFSEARLGEQENCLAHLTKPGTHLHHMHGGHGAHHHSDMNSMCALPLLMTHTKKSYSERTVSIFKKLMKEHPQKADFYRYLAAFYMLTLGESFQSLPAELKIDSPFTDFYSEKQREILREKHSWLKLPNKAKELGIDILNAGKGLAVEDFDGDGHLDMVVVDLHQPLRFFKGTGGKFIEKTESGLEKAELPFLATAVDLDNDGDLDIYVTRPGFSDAVYMNNGRGEFEDKTEAWGFQAGPQWRVPWVPAFADYDNDGDLDLFSAEMDYRFGSFRYSHSKLYRNDGGKFKDVTAEVGLTKFVEHQTIMGSAWGDVDGDGFPELVIASPNAKVSALFRNVQGKSFEKIHGVDLGPAFPTAFLDVDHDGDLDLFMSGTVYSSELAMDGTVYGKNTDTGVLGVSRVLLNSSGQLKEPILFPQHGIQSVMGGNYGDINNDGCVDFYLGTGTPEESYILPNLFYLGRTNAQQQCLPEWENISPLEGLGSIQKGHGIVFFDFNNDGAQDIYSNLGGAWLGDVWPNEMFVNESKALGAWVKIRLKGVSSNRHGVGAMIQVKAVTQEGEELTRYYYMNSKTGFGSAPYLAHIGLGKAHKISSVAVKWPGSQKWQEYRAEINQSVELSEQPR